MSLYVWSSYDPYLTGRTPIYPEHDILVMGDAESTENRTAGPPQSEHEPPAKRRRTRLEASCER